MNDLVLINQYLHQEAKLKKDQFLDRLKNVQQIRTGFLERNFLPGEAIEWEILEELHKAINSGVFRFGIKGYRIFAFEVKKNLYDWFRNNDLQTIQKQVINWIAAVYLSRPYFQKYLDDYIYPPVLEEVKRVISVHYSKDFTEKYKLLSLAVETFNATFDGHPNEIKIREYESFQNEHAGDIDRLFSAKESEYENASFGYINCLPPVFLQNPFVIRETVKFDDYGLKHSPLIKIKIAYFTGTDWLFIVERNMQKARELYSREIERGHMKISELEKLMKDAESDSMNRSEADKTIWNNWLYSYRNFDKTNSFIFSLFEQEANAGLIYLIRQRNTWFFKIGWTELKSGLTEKESVEKRIASLQTGNPQPLDLVGFFRASSTKTERTMHNYFGSKRATGEWFLLSDSDWQNILNDDWRINNSIF
jgi:hypothetical protein